MSDEVQSAQAADPEAIVPVETPAQVTETTEAEADAQAADDTPGEDGKPAKLSRHQRMKANRDAIIAERDAALARLAVLEGATKSKAPTEEDFPDIVDLSAERAVWRAEQKMTEREVEAERQRIAAANAREEEALSQNWTAQKAEAATKYTDFDAVIGQPGLFPATSPDIIREILKSDVAADVAYELARDRATHDALMKMNPVDAARVIGRIEARIAMPKPKTATSAPPPINAVKGSGSAADRDINKMSGAEYAAARAAGWKPF